MPLNVATSINPPGVTIMAKNQVMEMEDMDDEFDFDADEFCDHDHGMEDDVVSSMMNAMMETNRENMKVALELTKLICEKNSSFKSFMEKMMGADEEMA